MFAMESRFLLVSSAALAWWDFGGRHRQPFYVL